MTFGEEVRRRRLAAKLTLKTLSARSGLSPNFIGLVERGKKTPKLSSVLALAKGLRVNPGDLFGQRGLSPAAVEAGRLFGESPVDVQAAIGLILRHATRGRRTRGRGRGG